MTPLLKTGRSIWMKNESRSSYRKDRKPPRCRWRSPSSLHNRTVALNNISIVSDPFHKKTA